jgi:hypothetical protein
MSEQVKFTEAEIKSLDGIRNKYFEIQNAFGQLTISRMRIDEQLNKLEDSEGQLKTDLLTTNKEEQQFVDEISKKYGPGTLNPQDGTFTPNPVETEKVPQPA